MKSTRTQDQIEKEQEAGLDPSKLPGARKSALPGFFAPMGANLSIAAPHGSGWNLEIKWDGVRGLAYIDNGKLAIYTRNEIRCEKQYPELNRLPDQVAAKQAILDGEVVALDQSGISRFELIQPRIHIKGASPIEKLSREKPVRFIVFDLLYLDGYDLRQVPLVERKRSLAAVLRPTPTIRLSEHF